MGTDRILKKALLYLGRKADKALDDWLGLAVIVLAVALATWFGVAEEFHDWLAANK